MSGKPGPKPILPVVRRQVMLDQRTIDAALAIGDGNLSKGLRLAVAWFDEIARTYDVPALRAALGETGH